MEQWQNVSNSLF